MERDDFQLQVLAPLIQSWGLTRDKIYQIGQLFQEEYKSGSVEKSFYLTTFAYLLEVEGSFDEVANLVCSLFCFCFFSWLCSKFSLCERLWLLTETSDLCWS